MQKIDSAVLCPINNLHSEFYAKKGRAQYFIEPNDGVIFQSPLPLVKEMEDFNQKEYKSGAYRAYARMEALKKNTAFQRIKKIKKYGVADGSLLDVGCSVGFFLEVAQENGYIVDGVELSSEAIALAKDSIRGQIIQADANTFIRESKKSYDVVTAFDIIEHTQNPILFLKDLHEALKPGGVLVISAPDTDHFLRYIMGSSWPMLQPDQHTFLLSKRAIRKMLKAQGFENISVTTSKKTITINYIFGQLSQTNPFLNKLFKSVNFLLPDWLGNYSFEINIGEFLAVCIKPRYDKKNV